jgi:hypothetical protein
MFGCRDGGISAISKMIDTLQLLLQELKLDALINCAVVCNWLYRNIMKLNSELLPKLK